MNLFSDIAKRTKGRWVNYRARRKIFPSYPEGFRTRADAWRQEMAAWEYFGLSRSDAETALRNVTHADVIDEINSGKSELSKHTLLFAAIARSTAQVRSILEIGTYQGANTLVLARLFPTANVCTVDLPDDDPIFTASYGRHDTEQLAAMLRTRDRNLALASNIRSLRFNSICLMDRLTDHRFDLIWVDGDHSFPVVAFDLISAFHLLATDGWLMADDVFPTHIGLHGDASYSANHGFLALEYLRRNAQLDYSLFVKRESARFGRVLAFSKFVAFGRRGGRSGMPIRKG